MATTTRSEVVLMMALLLVVTSNVLMCTAGFSYPPAVCDPMDPRDEVPVDERDIDVMQFPLNLEFLEAEFFCYSALGYGLEVIEPELTLGGPPPYGAQRANLDLQTHYIITEFCYQEVAHVRTIERTFGGFPMPKLDLSAANFAKLMDDAFGHHLVPPFDPYRDPLSYMIATYVIPYVGLTGYVGANPLLKGYWSKRVQAGLLGVESGQDAVTRHYLYERGEEVVEPYNYTVNEFTINISNLRNQLGMCGIKDEGLIVPYELGAENRTMSNVLSADYNSLSYRRTPREILKIVYGTGNEHVPGGFFPYGANGRIARELREDDP